MSSNTSSFVFIYFHLSSVKSMCWLIIALPPKSRDDIILSLGISFLSNHNKAWYVNEEQAELERSRAWEEQQKPLEELLASSEKRLQAWPWCQPMSTWLPGSRELRKVLSLGGQAKISDLEILEEEISESLGTQWLEKHEMITSS